MEKRRAPMSGRRRRNVEMKDPGTVMGVDAYLCSRRTLRCNAFTDARATPMYADDGVQIMAGVGLVIQRLEKFCKKRMTKC